MSKKMKLANCRTDWDRIKEIRTKAFYGEVLTTEELKACKVALELDRERYIELGESIRSDYRSLFTFPWDSLSKPTNED